MRFFIHSFIHSLFNPSAGSVVYLAVALDEEHAVFDEFDGWNIVALNILDACRCTGAGDDDVLAGHIESICAITIVGEGTGRSTSNSASLS